MASLSNSTRRVFATALAALLLLLPARAVAQPAGHREHARLLRVARATPATVDPIEEARTIYAYQQTIIGNALVTIVDYMGAVVAAQEAEAQRQRLAAIVAYVQSLPRPAPPRPAPTPPPAPPAPAPVAPSGGGSCYAQPWIPAYIIDRESHGDPYVIYGGAHAPSPYASGGRAWGCFQFLPSTWAGACCDLGFDVSSQIECARRVSSNGTNLGPWR